MNRFIVHWYVPNVGNTTIGSDSLASAMKMIPEDATYFDVCKGNNLTLVENLVVWGGIGGFWANACDDTFPHNTYKKSEIEKILSKRVTNK